MFTLGIETTSRQLISNLSDQPLDLLPQYANGASTLISAPIFFAAVVVLGIALGFLFGRRRIVSFILVLYVTAALGLLIPLETFLPGGKTTSAYVLASLLILLILFFVLPAHFSGSNFWYIKWLWTGWFGLLSIGLLMCLVVQFAPSAWLVLLPLTVTKFFSNNIYKSILTFLPLVFLWIAAKNSVE